MCMDKYACITVKLADSEAHTRPLSKDLVSKFLNYVQRQKIAPPPEHVNYLTLKY